MSFLIGTGVPAVIGKGTCGNLGGLLLTPPFGPSRALRSGDLMRAVIRPVIYFLIFFVVGVR